MNRPPVKPPVAAADEPARILAEIEEAIGSQIDLARQARVEAMADLIRTVDTRLSHLAAMPPTVLSPHADQLARIDKLHRRLHLALQQRQQELGAARSHMRRGKVMLRAYGK